MPDHVHLLLTPSRDQEGDTFGITQIMNAIKGASSHAINGALSRRGAVWQQEWFDRMLRSDEGIRQKSQYICENPVRAGLVRSVDHYRWVWREWIEGVGMHPRADGRGRPSYES
jgi:REP element-mobilizing transposase RayT